MQQDDSGRAAEAFKLPAENVALGRLGRIYKALDRKTGRMLAVECIDVVDDAAAPDEGSSTQEITRQLLAAELERCGTIANRDEGRHVFCYASVSCSQSRVYLRSAASIIRSLAEYGTSILNGACATPWQGVLALINVATANLSDSLQKDFGRLHPLAVKQYIYQVIHGLRALHEIGVWCGGLSLSSLLLCGGNIVKIAAWFPSAQAVNTLQTQETLADPQFCRSNLGSQLTNDTIAQDVRSVAYVMLEMLTGLRARGALMEKSNLLSKVAAGSPEYQILSSLLALTPLKELLAHPYFSSVNPAQSTVFHDSSQATQEQRRIIGILTKQELKKCEVTKRQYLQQIRAWQTQFEKKYLRKPKPTDRPAGIVRLQGRCQALNERTQELNDRLAAGHGSIYRMISGNEALAVGASSQSLPAQHEDNLVQHKSTSDESMWPAVESECSISDAIGPSGERRSPAQKAFLNRFASPQ